MPIFFYIQRILLKTVVSISILMLAMVAIASYYGLKNVVEYKHTYFTIAFVLYLIYLLPLSRADRFNSMGMWDKGTLDPKVKEMMVAISTEAKKRVYSPMRAIPRLILMLLQISVLVYVIKTFLLPIIK